MTISPEEQNKLTEVLRVIDKELSALRLSRQAQLEDARLSGSDFAMANPYGAMYASLEVTMLQEKIGRHMSEIERMRQEIACLEDMRAAPYFGRVDFTEEGESSCDKIYVGLRTLSDSDNLDILVFDWRAPVCSLFYGGETGAASYTAPCGEINGTIDGIRQYRFNKGVLEACIDCSLRIDDSILLDTLSSSSGERLKVIAGSIQREQNCAIRYSGKRSLMVTGPAGCGKTSVGMHRLAWLLYNSESGLNKNNILMFTLSGIFRSYVTGILPLLGENEALSTDFGELFEDLLPQVRVLDAQLLTESVLSGDKERIDSVKRKYSADFRAFLEKKLNTKRSAYKDIRVYGKTVISGSELERKLGAFSEALPLKERLGLLYSFVSDEINSYFLINKAELFRYINDNSDIYASTRQIYDNLQAATLNSAKNRIFSRLPDNFLMFYINAYAEFYNNSSDAKYLRACAENGVIRFEDAVCTLYAAVVCGGYTSKEKPAHILIDEAQDLSEIQHLIIKKLYPKAVFTVLADTNQAITPEINTVSSQRIAEIYGCDILRLTKSYRSTKEINAFAMSFLPPEKRYSVFERSSEKPQKISTTDTTAALIDAINEKSQEYGTVCVITPSKARAQAVYAAIKDKVTCELYCDANSGFHSKKPVIMPVALTKGLEFDCVIIPFAEELQKNARTAYMMATRALHCLVLIENRKEKSGIS